MISVSATVFRILNADGQPVADGVVFPDGLTVTHDREDGHDTRAWISLEVFQDDLNNRGHARIEWVNDTPIQP